MYLHELIIKAYTSAIPNAQIKMQGFPYTYSKKNIQHGFILLYTYYLIILKFH